MFPIRIGLASSLVKFDELSKVAQAINLQVSRDLGPIWNIRATVEPVENPNKIPLSVWPIFIVDSLPPDEGGVHKTNHNQPYALVEVGNTWSLSASHECLEMLVDPSGNRLVASSSVGVIDNEVHEVPGKFEYLVEVCDPSEDPANAYMIDEVLVSDFYTPNYFDPVLSQGVRYSFTGKINRPRLVLPNGYLSWYNPLTRTLQQLKCFGAPQILDLGPAAGLGGASLREFVDRRTKAPVHLSRLKRQEPILKWRNLRANELMRSSSSRSLEYQEPTDALYAAASSLPTNDPNKIIKSHLKDFKIPGVISVRRGYLFDQGRITDNPAIVVTVEPEEESRVSERLSPAIDGVPVVVRSATPTQLLRFRDPQTFALLAQSRQELQVPAFSDEVFVNVPNFSSTLADLFAAAKAPAKQEILYTAPEGVTLSAVQEEVTLLLHVSPEQGWTNLSKFIQDVKRELVVGMYDFTSKHILDQVSQSLANDKLIITLDHPPKDPSADQTDEATIDALRSAIPPMKSAWALENHDPKASAYIYPTAYHIKVAVREDDTFWLSSGNWNNSNQPEIDLSDDAGAEQIFKKSDRDWHVIVQSPTLARVFREFLSNDYSVASQHNDPQPSPALTAALGLLPTLQVPPDLLEGLALKPRQFFPPRSISGNIKIQPLLTPDNYQGHVLALIQSATEKFYMQTQYVHPGAQADDANHQALIDAIQAKIAAGVDVRIITSQYETMDWVEKLKDTGFDTSVIRYQQRVHNKGIVVDGAVAMVSSQNWSPDGTLRNRDAGLIIWSQEAASYLEEIFLHDWTYLSTANIPPARKPSFTKEASGPKQKLRKTTPHVAKPASVDENYSGVKKRPSTKSRHSRNKQTKLPGRKY